MKEKYHALYVEAAQRLEAPVGGHNTPARRTYNTIKNWLNAGGDIEPLFQLQKNRAGKHWRLPKLRTLIEMLERQKKIE